MPETREPYADELPDLFSEAISLDPPTREAMLNALRTKRPALAARLDELLSADRDAGAFLERPLASPGVSATLGAGDVVEGFRVESNIASGANGSVYRAVQDYPRRTVALKVLHFALPSAGAIARFRQEVRTLARLSHPGIVPLFAAGVIDPESRALPWFAMELIDGARNLRAWAREQPIEARVRAIADACDAVHHAHLKGVVHRDLKPGNILVGADDRPRVIDFGVATSTGSAATLATHIGSLTPEGAVVGTLAYMSPEQLEAARDIDGRADVYALGVILYEVCTGRLPFDLGRTPAQAMRAIAIDAAIDPVRAAPDERALRGDLAAIMLRAIERDPSRRYESAADFGADLRRWLAGEPVVARRPGFSERAWRAIRRRPVLSTAVILSALAATGITVASVLGASYAYREAMRAQRYITGLLTALSDPSIEGRQREARMADAADSIVRAVDSTRLPPNEDADGRMIAARMYELLGMTDEALVQYRLALALRQAEFGVTSSEALETLTALGRAAAFKINPDGPRGDARAVEAIASSFRSLVASLGWSDPRTLDAFGWSATSLSPGEIRTVFDTVSDADVSEQKRAVCGAMALTALTLHGELLADPQDRARIQRGIESTRRAFGNGVTEDASAVAAFTVAVIDAPPALRTALADDARQFANAVMPALDRAGLPASACFARRRFAHVVREFGDIDTALRLLQYNLADSRGDNAAERRLRYSSGQDAARILVDQGRPVEGRAQIHWIESERDDIDTESKSRLWRARALAMQAHAARKCGDIEGARNLAARARAVAATLAPSLVGGSEHFERDLEVAESATSSG